MESEVDNWRKKLGLLEYQRTVSADPATQFQLNVVIAKYEEKIMEIENALKTTQNHGFLNQAQHSDLKQLPSHLGLKDEEIKYIGYTKQRLDSVLKFLTAFGVLKEYKSGHFRILAKYLQDAIEAHEPQLWLKETLEMRKL
jgi:hypothetical protein